jgi:hypothetical protein
MLVYSITAETQYRRTPPFQKTENTTHLGDYTHSHENVEQLTFTCFPIGECQVCSPLEKVYKRLFIYALEYTQLIPCT